MTKNILVLDVETYSDLDLGDHGAWAYAHHPSTEILMCAYYDPKQHEGVQVAIGEEAIRNIPGLFDPNTIKVAHNAPFERFIFKGRFGVLAKPEEYIDTAAYGACYGLPRKLKLMAPALGVGYKDEAGVRLINKFSKPHTRRGVTYRNDLMSDPIDFMRFVEYCKQDVWITYLILKKLSAQPLMQTPLEKDIYHCMERINDRGVPLDTKFARDAQRLVDENIQGMNQKFREMTGGVNPNSPKQVREWLIANGVTPGKSLDADSVDALLKTGIPEEAASALRVKKKLTKGSLARFETLANYGAHDFKAHGCFAYYGAHTGRTSGYGINFQNLPNGAFDNDEETLRAMGEVRGGEWLGHDDMKKLIRACLKGPWIVSDFSAIEARVLAWIAGEQWVLDTFEAGKDIYVQTAAMMHGIDYYDAVEYRKQGKVATLACGYQGGQSAIQVFSGDTFTREERQSMVDKYRKANPRIKSFWDSVLPAFTHGGKIGEFVTVEVVGASRKIILPSGRAIFYHDVTFEKRPLTYVNRDGVEVTSRVLSPVFNKGQRRDATSAGKITENIVQGIARDLLGEALLRLERNGFDVRCHVHDEVLILKQEGDTQDEVTRVMSVTPDWAPGLPLEAGTYECEVYRKE